MAESTAVAKIKERFGQQARAGLPFNPLDGAEIVGANVHRLKLGMEAFGWVDLRFVTREQADYNGWALREGAESVQITLRDPSNGTVSERELFNAENVLGMPSLQAMLAMPEGEILRMRGERAAVAAGVEVPTAAVDEHGVVGEDLDDEIEIGPALQPELQQDVSPLQAPADLFFAPPVAQDAASQQQQASEVAQRDTSRARDPSASLGAFAVMAPYWIDGLHNFEGVELAKQVNKLIESQKLARDKAAIATLLQSYPNARRLGLDVVDRERLLSDPHLKANVSEPLQLLGGELVRDREGDYRPKAGGQAVLKDKGTSLVLKNKSELAYRGAMELALMKGWKAIEIKGKPKVMAQAWLEAKVMGLDVVNYKPTDQDREKLAARMAEKMKKREASASRAEQSPEDVEVVPVVDSRGKTTMASVTHTTAVGPSEAEPAVGSPAVAQGQAAEVITRSVTRVGDVVRSDVAASMASGVGGAADAVARAAERAAEPVLEREASAAVDEAERHRASVATLEGQAADDLPVRLVAHGAAPYRHNEANGMSYFADVEVAQGVVKTFWGKDLQRSLGEAGAQVGDKIVLKEAGRAPMVGADGKTTHPVKWETSVAARGQEVSASAAGVEIATSGLHVGPIVKVEGGRVAQKAGREPNKLVWHDISVFNGQVPGIGENAEINYGKGGVEVKTPAREQELSR